LRIILFGLSPLTIITLKSEDGVTMRRRMIGLSGLITASLLATTVGCESLRHETRPHKKDDVETVKADGTEPKAVNGDATKVLGFDSQGKAAGGSSFFRNSRLPGAMSPEGRDIEQSLGIH
jgi:hypothetical protein